MARKKRSQAEKPRQRFLYTDVTPAEHKEIQEYCRERQISVSQFVADLVLKEASKSGGKRDQRIIVQIELTPSEHDKLELLTRLHQKHSMGELIHDVLEPEFRAQRLRVPLKTKMLRFYLSDEEHQAVMKHIKRSGISARNYAAMLVLRAIRQADEKRKK